MTSQENYLFLWNWVCVAQSMPSVDCWIINILDILQTTPFPAAVKRLNVESLIVLSIWRCPYEWQLHHGISSRFCQQRRWREHPLVNTLPRWRKLSTNQSSDIKLFFYKKNTSFELSNLAYLTADLYANWLKLSKLIILGKLKRNIIRKKFS